MFHLRVLRFALVLAALLPVACGGDDPAAPPATAPNAEHPLLGTLPEAGPDAGTAYAEKILAVAGAEPPKAGLTVDYPLDESIFPPEFVAPTFRWHDEAEGADTWLVSVDSGSGEPILVLVPGDPPADPVYDMQAFGPTNEPYPGTDYQRSARTWTPSAPVWETIKERSVEAAATISFTGFAAATPKRPLSRGEVRIRTSRDPVGATLFYRDVPLMPSEGEKGKISPLGPQAIPLIAWRVRDVSRPESRVVLKSMPTCGNCHSFSRDGKTLGMDVDGPDGDKGMYALKALKPETVIGSADVITWNSFPGKPEGHRTIG